MGTSVWSLDYALVFISWASDFFTNLHFLFLSFTIKPSTITPDFYTVILW